MDPAVWGPSMWKSIHCVALTYPKNPTIIDKQHYRLFYENLMHVLPCSVCRKNYEKEFWNFPIDEALDSRESLTYWTIDLHNSVNKRLGKPVLSYQEVYDIYKDLIKEQKEKRAKEGKDVEYKRPSRSDRNSDLSDLINSLSGVEMTQQVESFVSRNGMFILGGAVALFAIYLSKRKK